MKLGVTGSRTWLDRQKIEDALSAISPRPSVVIHGGALGVDLIARAWAKANGIPHAIVRPAREDVKADYLARNAAIVSLADWVIAFRSEGKSNGTDFTIDKAREYGKLLKVVHEDSE